MSTINNDITSLKNNRKIWYSDPTSHVEYDNTNNKLLIQNACKLQMNSVNNNTYSTLFDIVNNSNETVHISFQGTGNYNTIVYNQTTKNLTSINGLTYDYLNSSNVQNALKNTIAINQWLPCTGSL